MGNADSFSPIAMGICGMVIHSSGTFMAISMDRHKELISHTITGRSSFLGPWTRLTWLASYQTNPKEYFKAIQEENRRRDKTGWRRIAQLNQQRKNNPAIGRRKAGSRYVPKEKKKGRPCAGTFKARNQTAAACEANRRRHALNRLKKETKVKQGPE